ncbi:hypothetical protein [Amycolatopsis magusensis]|uniref:hypothetical protein n=1 Tax=Amycolatopsis magusensis TaxID=882444 RepID=UPI0037B16A5B
MDTAPALLDPQRQFLGCLMQLPTRPARRLLAGMRADDMAAPLPAMVLQLAIETVAADRPPAPAALFAHAVATGRASGDTRRRLVGRWITDAYSDAPPAVLADYLKAAVLADAWRRAVAEHAARLTQAAAESPAEIVRDLCQDTAHLDALWDRYTAATGQHAPATRLGAVA